MANSEETMQGTGFNDRKGWLVVFGILEIILGALCALAVPLMIISIIATAVVNKTSAPPMSIGMLIYSVLFYSLLAVWFIWLGIGSIKARRWARALWLVSSWAWLISGVIGFVFMLVAMPDIFERMPQTEQMSKAVLVVMKVIILGFMVLFYLIIPGTLVLFYGSRNVKKTCESRDPVVRWTDKCPLPVLALSLIYGFGAFSILLMGFYGWLVPFFGHILSGTAGAAAALVMVLLTGYIAWGAYKLDIKAWWTAVWLVIVFAASIGITFSRLSLWDFYEKMNLPEQQLQAIKQIGLPDNTVMAVFFGISVIGFIRYLLYTRRYFILPPVPEQSVNTINKV